MTKLVQLSIVLCMVVASIAGAALAAPNGTLPQLGELQDEAEEPRAVPYVFNGEPVDNPGWVASILWEGDFLCTASLIHAEWILTAAHCVEEVDSTYSVNVGSAQWDAGISRQIAEVSIHPDYDPSTIESVDLAMLRLSAPVAASSLPRLSSVSSWPSLNQPLVVVGWGQTFTGSPPASTLQAGAVWVDSDSSGTVNEDWCNRSWVSFWGYEDFCFGGLSWACPGDSGGPLVGYASPTSTSGAVETIYGVTSFGQAVGCSEIWVDSVAQRVSPYIGWINGHLPPPGDNADEVLFYRSSDGVFKYYDMKLNASLGYLYNSGTYSLGWDSITAVDLDGDSNDEQFFYRSSDGVFKYYDVKSSGSLGALLASGVYSLGWDSITKIDVDGDGRDEFFFYRSSDGVFKYYRMNSNGSVGALMSSGAYSLGWDSITAVDLDGDGNDEQFFYRSSDGVFKYYDVKSSGSLGALLASGVYSLGWDSITKIDVDGDGRDEFFFYRSSDGVFKYYRMNSNGSVGALMSSGAYSIGWSSITAINFSD